MPRANEQPKKTLQEKARRVLDKAPEALRDIEKSYIFQKSSAKLREFPHFDSSEIEIGNLLGKGGFSGVKEVSTIAVKEDDNTYSTDEGHHEDQGKDHEEHYDVCTAKNLMAKHCQRLGSARYAVKRLKSDLDEFQGARGALDLAIEIKFMSAFWHPNIVKMRGISNTPEISFDTFIIMDRLYGTLDDKIDVWHRDLSMLKGCCGVTKNNPAVRDLLKDRLLVAYDLSAAFHYLHGFRLVYRDIKPENIGFDIRGDVKIFDFGLCRSLEDRDKVEGGYNLTAKTGSIPYMAPEVVFGKPYNQSADVFSFGILLWELLTLQWAFNGYLAQEFFIRVAKNNERLLVPRDAPPMIRAILPEAWDKDPKNRPTMKRMGALIRGELEDITADSSVVNRTQHMMNQSARSQHLRMLNGSGRPNLSMSNSRNGRRDSFIGGESVDNADEGRMR